MRFLWLVVGGSLVVGDVIIVMENIMVAVNWLGSEVRLELSEVILLV